MSAQERKGEIDSLKQQLSEFEESAQPLRAYALAGLREREAEAGGVATLDRDDDSNTKWDNDWGRIQLNRQRPGCVVISRPGPVDGHDDAWLRNMLETLSCCPDVTQICTVGFVSRCTPQVMCAACQQLAQASLMREQQCLQTSTQATCCRQALCLCILEPSLLTCID